MPTEAANGISLDDWFAAGATIRGVPVTRAELWTADGQKVSLELKPRDQEEDGGDLSRNILSVLSKYKAGEWCKGATIVSDFADAIDHTSGSFRRVIAKLVSEGKIESSAAGYRLKTK